MTRKKPQKEKPQSSKLKHEVKSDQAMVTGACGSDSKASHSRTATNSQKAKAQSSVLKHEIKCDQSVMTDARELDSGETHSTTSISSNISISTINYLAYGQVAALKDVPSLQYLDIKANEIRISLSDSGQYVMWKDIIIGLLKKYNCRTINELGLRRCDQLKTIRDLVSLQSYIDSFLIEYDMATHYSTIFELEKIICKYLGKTMFSDLYVGPLCSNVNVQRMFNLAPNLRSVPPIRFSDIFSHLNGYMIQTNSWAKPLDVDDFEEYLKIKYNVDDKRKLGVKIANCAPLMKALKNVRRLQKESNIEGEEKLKAEFMEKFDNQRLWLSKRLDEKLSYLKNVNQIDFDRFQDIQALYARSFYTKLEPFQALEMLLQEFSQSSNILYSSKINSFLSSIKNDKYLQKLFHLGICFSKFPTFQFFTEHKYLSKAVSLKNDSSFFNFLQQLFVNFIFESISTDEVVELLNQIFSVKQQQIFIQEIGTQQVTIRQLGNTNQVGFQEPQNYTIPNRPTLYDLKNQIKEILTKNSSNFDTVLSLLILKKVEDKLLKHYSCNQFSNLGHGTSLLQFLHQNESLFDEIGSIIATDKKLAKSISIQKKHFISHLKQLYKLHKTKIHENNTEQLIESILTKYYSISNINELGFGNFKYLLKNIEINDKETTNTDDYSINSIIYEDSLLDDNLNNIPDRNDDKDHLINLFDKCHIFENLIEFTNWNLFYSHKYGNIKEFILSINKQYNKNITVIEINQTVLLKLDTNTSIEKLKESIIDGDYINSAAQLVSLISVKYQSMKNAPIVLLQNEIVSSLSEYLMKTNRLDDDDDDEAAAGDGLFNKNKYSHFYSFISNFLFKLPLKFASNVLNCFFIETLTKIVTSGSVKEEIYKQCAIYEDLSLLKRLHDLGKLCEIKEWSEGYWPNYIKLRKSETRFRYAKRVSQLNDEVSVQDVVKNSDSNNQCIQPLVEPEILHELVIDGETKPIIEDKPQNNDATIDSSDESVKHIEQIRKETFGANLESNEESKNVISKLKGILGRGLERLSKDLYNEDIHFVLELIQNADDNTYLTNNEPTLVFFIETEKIVLLNNEVGFAKENIEAICNIGGSTKKSREQGFIGCKGIGFKSVFTVTDSPQIHSKGYHIKFDVSKGDSIGYILPIWCDQNEIINDCNIKQELNSLVSLEPKYGQINTCIHLPLKSNNEIEKRKSELVVNSFTNIQHSLLLFLNRLKNIIIVRKYVDEIGAASLSATTMNKKFIQQIYHRNDINENIIEIDCGYETTKWLMARDKFKVPQGLKSNQLIENTEITLAFPIHDLINYLQDINDNNNNNNKQLFLLRKYEVCAFLPLKDFGFSFIIQADFEVPSSRQDVIHDSYWNQMLLDRIPNLFVKSLNLFKKYFNNNELIAIKLFIKFIPNEDEIVGFFKNIPKQIYELLRRVEFLPIDHDASSLELIFKKPIECVIIKEQIIRDLLTPEMLLEQLGRYYLHSSLYDIDIKILNNLGVRHLNIKDILDILKNSLNKYINKFNDLKYTAKWLVALKRCLDNTSINDEDYLFKQLRQLNFIPLLNSKHKVNLEEFNVFFPLDNKITAARGHTNDDEINKIKKLNFILNDINIIDLNSLLCLDEKDNLHIYSILNDLGVKHINYKNLIESHVLNQLSNQEILKNKNKNVLIQYLGCLFNYWFINENNIDLKAISSSLLILTNKGFVNTKSQQICFTNFYGNCYDLKQLFPYFEWCLIDDCYLKDSLNIFHKNENKDKIIANWRRFLKEIGLCDFNNIDRKKIIMTSDEIAGSKYSLYADLLPQIRSNEVYVVNDAVLPIFDFYLNLLKNEKEDKIALLNWLSNLYILIERNWKDAIDSNEPFRSNLYVKVSVAEKIGDNMEHKKTLSNCNWESEFFRKLKNEKWVVGKLYSDAKTSIDVYKPSELFIEVDYIKSFYGVKVPYIACYNAPYVIRDDHYLLKELDVIRELNSSQFLDQIKSWFNNEASVYGNVRDVYSLRQMKTVYSWLSQQLQGNNNFFMNFIKTNPIIFIPTRKTNEDEYVEGKFYRIEEVFISDKTGLFKKYNSEIEKLLLRNYYNDKKYENIFYSFGVILHPLPEIYVDLISDIEKAVQVSNFNFQEAVADIYYIFEFFMVNYKLIVSNTGGEDSIEASGFRSCLQHILTVKAIWPCINQKWASLAEYPIIVDDTDLAGHFIDKLNYLCIPVYDQYHGYINDGRILSKMEHCNQENLTDDMKFLFHGICGIKNLSEVIKTDVGAENITVNLRPAPQVQNICRKVVSYVQCFLAYKKGYREIYDMCMRAKFDELLPKMKFYSVKSLETVWSFIHDRNKSAVISKKYLVVQTAENNLTYYVCADIIENEKEIFVGFMDCFIGNNFLKKNELVKFVKLILPYLSTELTVQDRKDIEKEHGIKLDLEPTEPIWKIDEAKIIFPTVPAPKPSTDDEKIKNRTVPQYKYVQNQQEIPCQKQDSTVDRVIFNTSEPDNQTNDGNNAQKTAFPVRQIEMKGEIHHPNNTAKQAENVNNDKISQHSNSEKSQESNKNKEKFNKTTTEAASNSNKTEKPTSSQVSNSEKRAEEEKTEKKRELVRGKENVATETDKNDVVRKGENNQNTNDKITKKESHSSNEMNDTSERVKKPLDLNSIKNAKKYEIYEEIEKFEVDWSEELTAFILSFKSNENENLKKIGRYGELWVHEMLKQKYKNEIAEDKVCIKWINEDEETGEPYDLKVTFKNNDDKKLDRTEYLEVKSTINSELERKHFPVSLNQLMFAQNNQNSFFIYRLYNVGNGDPSEIKCRIIREVANKINNHDVGIFMIV